MSKPKILLQLDADNQPSVFDAVVAADAGVDQLLRHGNVAPSDVQGLVHGAMFTRGPQDLASTAIFIGGSNAVAGEQLLSAVTSTFFGPLRVSVMLDSNGANTTAAAAVLAAARHVDLPGAEAIVLGATGPVGQRAARLLAGQGARVRLASRSAHRANEAFEAIRHHVENADVSAYEVATPDDLHAAMSDVSIVIAAGAAGVCLLPTWIREETTTLRVAIDLNAVPPAGIEGVEVSDCGQSRHGAACYGAIGVGGDKMKIHKTAVQSLFDSNDQVLDAEQIFALGKQLLG